MAELVDSLREALKRSEERLLRSQQLMVDIEAVAHLGTWEWDVSEPTATWSAELYRIYGVTPETYTPSYEGYLEKVHPEDRQRVIDATNRVFHNHIPYSHDERVYRPDGTMRYLHTWAYPVLDDAGKLTRLMGVCQDITDRELAAAALHEVNVELERRVSDRTNQLELALRDLEAFNAMASHDLRAPLTVVEVAVELIDRERAQLSAASAEHLQRIRRACKTMTALIEDLLTLARVGQRALQVRDVDLTAMCGEILAELRATDSQRQVIATVEPGLRCRLDPNLFRSALANVIGNAWKYSSRQTVARIEIGRSTNALIVRDNGIGFDMKDHDRLFAPFERLAGATEFAGTGVGLPIVQRIVERHGGRVTAQSAVGEGATFSLELPAALWLG